LKGAEPMCKSISILVLLATIMSSGTVNADIAIELQNPGSFLDLKMPDVTSSKGQEQFIRSMTKELAGLTDEYLENNQRLHITFENIDLAGRIEPMRGMQNQELRVVKTMDPIRLTFSYQLIGAENTLIKEGSADLRDFVRQTDMYGRGRYKTLYFERRMMEGWFRSEFSIN
jgi:Protein of unknown function (DUF3016)